MQWVMGNNQDEVGNLIIKWYERAANKKIYGPFGAIGFYKENYNIIGAAIFQNYNGANIDIHIYGPGCMTKANYKKILDYVFNDIKCVRLTVIVPRSNKKMLRILDRLKFEYETVLKSYYGKDKKDDGVVHRMTAREASNWITVNG